MLPHKILKIGILKTPFSTLLGRNMWQNLKDEIVCSILFRMNSGTGLFPLHFLLQAFFPPETELAGIFFKRTPTPSPPSQELNGRPLTCRAYQRSNPSQSVQTRTLGIAKKCKFKGRRICSNVYLYVKTTVKTPRHSLPTQHSQQPRYLKQQRIDLNFFLNIAIRVTNLDF